MRRGSSAVVANNRRDIERVEVVAYETNTLVSEFETGRVSLGERGRVPAGKIGRASSVIYGRGKNRPNYSRIAREGPSGLRSLWSSW